MTSLAHKALRPIAVFEAIKGLLVLVLGCGLLSLLGHDTEDFARRLILRMHLDPANHFLEQFVDRMATITDKQLILGAVIALMYASVRFVEAYGLWHARRWAEWFAAFSGGVYVPIEVYELILHPTWVHLATLLLNLVIVAYMVWLLTESKRRRAVTEKELGGS